MLDLFKLKNKNVRQKKWKCFKVEKSFSQKIDRWWVRGHWDPPRKPQEMWIWVAATGEIDWNGTRCTFIFRIHWFIPVDHHLPTLPWGNTPSLPSKNPIHLATRKCERDHFHHSSWPGWYHSSSLPPPKRTVLVTTPVPSLRIILHLATSLKDLNDLRGHLGKRSPDEVLELPIRTRDQCWCATPTKLKCRFPLSIFSSLPPLPANWPAALCHLCLCGSLNTEAWTLGFGEALSSLNSCPSQNPCYVASDVVSILFGVPASK